MMKDNETLTAEETIEVGKEVRSMRAMFLKIIGVSMIPLIVMGISLCIISNISMRRILEDEVRKSLRMAAYGLSQSYRLIDDGDFIMADDGTVFKGSAVVSERLTVLGDEMLKNGMVCTFFFGDTRIDTTVTDEHGNSMIGTKLDGDVYRRLCDTGEEYFTDSMQIGGRTYYGYYIPFRNSDGKVATVFFAGRLRDDVLASVWSVTETTLWTGLLVLIIGIVVLLLCTIYMTGFIFKHFKVEENINLKKLAAKEQRDFMTLVSRELRDPVDSITILSDKILDAETSPQIREHVLGIKEASNSMIVSFNSIYDYSVLEADEAENNVRDYDLFEVVRGCCQKIGPGMERKGIEFDLNFAEGIPGHLSGDYEKIRRILDNLLENAVKYTYDGKISLSVDYRTITPDKIDLSFTVKDTGIGIRKEDAEKLFHSIGKVGQSKDVSIKGTGLGLLICKQLVSVLDGRISVDSEIGKGSTFKFTVPQDVVSRAVIK